MSLSNNIFSIATLSISSETMTCLALLLSPTPPEIAAFKDVPSDKEALSSIHDRPFAARCCQSCCLHTYNKLDPSLANRPLRDILRLDKIYKKQNFILRNICLM